jgi:ABC-type transport system involved in cytochrome c biogenesis permease subunit
MRKADSTTNESGAGAKNSPPPKPAAPAPRGFRKWFPVGLAIFFGVWALGGFRPAPEKTPFRVNDFGKLPVVLEGRVQPLDSVARNTLLIMRSKRTLAIEPAEKMTDIAKMFKTKRVEAIDWMLEVIARPKEADARKLFRIDHSDLKSLLKLAPEEKHFAFNELVPEFQALRKESQRINEAARAGRLETQQQTPFEKAVVRLSGAVTTYLRLKSSFQPENAVNFVEEIDAFEKSIGPGIDALKKREGGQEHNEEDLAALMEAFKRFDNLEQIAYPLIIPPTDPANKDGWMNMGASLKASMRSGTVVPAARSYAKMITAYAKNQPEVFNAALAEYKLTLESQFAKEVKKGREEAAFNHFEPFIKSLTIYLVAFLFACAYWINLSPMLRSAAVALAWTALPIHVVGLIYRMHLEGRPPVTNLYSSAIFVGLGAVALAMLLERFFKNTIGVLVASFVGFVTLVIAHNLSLDGDTMKMLQAVLDTNIWLATHVVVVTLGYSAMFVAGLLGMLYVALGVFTRNLDANTGKSLGRMTYGTICFATLFSFVGTVLGGIWADQSWGRFWGWDPKENGALLIVIWCAVVLHARWGGMIRERGLMAMAMFGNIVTAFSWFGVNMLGVGLHSYGFMDEAFKWLVIFNISQVVFIGLVLMPSRFWKSPPGGGAAKPTGASLGKSSEATAAEQLAAAQKMLPENPAP